MVEPLDAELLKDLRGLGKPPSFDGNDSKYQDCFDGRNNPVKGQNGTRKNTFLSSFPDFHGAETTSTMLETLCVLGAPGPFESFVGHPASTI